MNRIEHLETNKRLYDNILDSYFQNFEIDKITGLTSRQG